MAKIQRRKEVGNKYEVSYWDYYVGKEVTVTYTDSFLKALWLVRKYGKNGIVYQ